MTAILNEEAADALPAAVPPALARIVSRCMEKAREARFQSARDLAFGLEVLTGTTGAASAPPVPGRRRGWTALAIAIVIVSVAAAVASWMRGTAQSVLDNPLALAKSSLLTDFGGTEMDATISPDGKFVAFLSDRSGPFHVWLKPVGPGSSRDLTPGEGDYRNAGPTRSVGFSGDGGEIWVNGTYGRRMMRMPFTGGVPLPFLVQHAVNVVWSPDGSSLVYFTFDGDPLIVANRTGDNPRELLPPRKGDHNHFPAWSSDGRWIYYAHGEQSVSQYDVWRIPSAGGTPEQLTHQNTDIRYLTMIDARTLLYVAPDDVRSGPWLWALDVERKVTRRVSGGLERYLSIAASRDGSRLVATVAAATGGLWTVPILDRIAETGDVKPYPVPTTRAQAPRFGNDSLFYLSSSGAGEGLWRMLGGNAVEVWRGSDDPLMEVPAVSPRDDRLAVVSNPGSPRLILVSADGADRKPLADTIVVRGAPSWSPDGNSIVTGGRDADGPGLFKIPVDGGKPVRLVTGPATDPQWSPTGRFIVYMGQQDANAPLLAVREDGSAMEFPAITVPTGGRGRARFLPNGKGLVYVTGSTLADRNFWYLDTTTFLSRQLTKLTNGANTDTFDISPDGTHIVFDRVLGRSDVVLIDLPKPAAAR
jgi:Tol biopolymer transport system component